MQKSSNTAMPSKTKLSKTEIHEILKEAAAREEPVMFSPSEIAASFFCQIKEITESEIIIKNPVPPDLAWQVLKSQDFYLFCRAYRIGTKELTPRGTDLVFKIPSEAELSRDRTEERIYYRERDNAHVLVLHPFDRATILKRKVFDVSKGGLSFRARVLSSFVQPGRILPEIQLYVRDEKKMTRQGKIVYVTQIIDTDGSSFHQVGVKFTDRATQTP